MIDYLIYVKTIRLKRTSILKDMNFIIYKKNSNLNLIFINLVYLKIIKKKETLGAC